MEDVENTLASISQIPMIAKPSPTNLIGSFIGSYHVLALLGSGGSGSVYVAEHPIIGTKVAIKVLRAEVASMPGMAERFVDEARTSSQIDSVHVPRYFDFGHLPDGRPYAVLEFLEGETVAQQITREGPLPTATSMLFAHQAATALARAHAINLVHRDVKPENLFVTRSATGEAQIKVIDFGIAKLMDDSAAAKNLTAFGAFMGTPAFCAPEQILGTAVGPATDIYALGTTLYCMLTGRTPFDANGGQAFAAKTTHEAPPVTRLRPDVSPRLTDLIARMIRLNPDERPRSFDEVVVELDTMMKDEAVIYLAFPTTDTDRATSHPDFEDEKPRGKLLTKTMLVLGPRTARRLPALLLASAVVAVVVAFTVHRGRLSAGPRIPIAESKPIEVPTASSIVTAPMTATPIVAAPVEEKPSVKTAVENIKSKNPSTRDEAPAHKPRAVIPASSTGRLSHSTTNAGDVIVADPFAKD